MNGLSDCLWSKKVFTSTLLKRSRVRDPLFFTHSQLPSCISKITVRCVDKDALETTEKSALEIKPHHLTIFRSNLQTGKWTLSPLWTHALFFNIFSKPNRPICFTHSQGAWVARRIDTKEHLIQVYMQQRKAAMIPQASATWHAWPEKMTSFEDISWNPDIQLRFCLCKIF